MSRFLLSNIAVRLLGNALNFLLALLVTRYYGALGKGEMSYILTVITFVSFFSNVFSGNSLIYSYSKHQFKTLYFTSMMWILIVCCIEFVMLSMFIQGNAEYIFRICILTALQSIFTLFYSVLLANKELVKCNILSVSYVILNILVLLALYFIIDKQNLGAILSMLFISGLLIVILSIAMSTKYIVANRIQIDIEEIRIILTYGFRYQLFDFLQFIMLRFSFLLLYQFEGKVSLGVFSIGISFIESIWIVSRSISVLNYIDVANASKPEQKAKLTLKLMRWSVLTSLLLVSIMFLVPIEIYTDIFGESCKVLKLYMRWLIPGAIIFPIFITIQSFYLGLGKMNLNIIAAGLGSFISIVLGFILIRSYEMTGTAFTMSVSFTACSLFLLYHFFKSNNFVFKDLLFTKSDIRDLKISFTQLTSNYK